MKLSMKVYGLSNLKADLTRRAAKSKKNDDGDVVVGYTMNYALHVHERTDLAHKPGKQAKFLETAYKMVHPEIQGIVKTVYQASGSIVKGLLVAGLRIQRESQKIVPVLTGALKNSAYTAREVKPNKSAKT